MQIHVRERDGWEGLSLCELSVCKLCWFSMRERDDARGGNQKIINNKQNKNKKTKFLDHVASTPHTSHHLSFSGMVGYLICGSMSHTSVILMLFFFLITRHLSERTNSLGHTHNSDKANFLIISLYKNGLGFKPVFSLKMEPY